MNNGSLAIYTWQPVSPGSSIFDYENRYFDGFSWGSNLFATVGADQAHLYSDYYQDLPYVCDDYAFSLDADIGLGVQAVEGDSVITTWTLLDGLCQLRQTISYQPGSTLVSKVFEITNLSAQNEALIDLRFMHGGDIYFGRDASCTFDDATQAITVRNLDASIGGLMALTPGPDSPLDSWFAGWIEDLFYETASGNLPGTVVANDEDIGVQLQWNRDVLNAGETWTITLTEQFAEDASDETGESSESVTTTTTETTVRETTSSETAASEMTTTTETDASEATTTETDASEATTTETDASEATTTETADPEVTTTEATATEMTTETILETTSTEMSQIQTSESDTTTSTSSEQDATTTTSNQDETTSTSTDQSIPATGEGGSCQFIAGGMMLLIVALYCWFKRMQSCH